MKEPLKSNVSLSQEVWYLKSNSTKIETTLSVALLKGFFCFKKSVHLPYV